MDEKGPEMNEFHLAQLNIGKLIAPPGDPRVAEFMDNLALVNGLAERSPGFVWRLKGEGDGATDIHPFSDPEIIVNLTVWETMEALEKFVWLTVHKRFFHRRGEWFQPLGRPHFVMWHVPAGHIPTIAEAGERLERLTREGPGAEAFGWEQSPQAKLWREARGG